MMNDVGSVVWVLGYFLFWIGLAGVGITWVFTCEGPARFTCGDDNLVTPFAIVLFISLIMIYTGNKFRKNKLYKK